MYYLKFVICGLLIAITPLARVNAGWLPLSAELKACAVFTQKFRVNSQRSSLAREADLLESTSTFDENYQPRRLQLQILANTVPTTELTEDEDNLKNKVRGLTASRAQTHKWLNEYEALASNPTLARRSPLALKSLMQKLQFTKNLDDATSVADAFLFRFHEGLRSKMEPDLARTYQISFFKLYQTISYQIRIWAGPIAAYAPTLAALEETNVLFTVDESKEVAERFLEKYPQRSQYWIKNLGSPHAADRQLAQFLVSAHFDMALKAESIPVSQEYSSPLVRAFNSNVFSHIPVARASRPGERYRLFYRGATTFAEARLIGVLTDGRPVELENTLKSLPKSVKAELGRKQFEWYLEIISRRSLQEQISLRIILGRFFSRLQALNENH